MLLISSQPAQAGFVLLAGTAVNQGGRASSLTAPNGPSQQEAIRMALDSSGELQCSLPKWEDPAGRSVPYLHRLLGSSCQHPCCSYHTGE